jgi:hypothetical protein
MKSTLYKIIDFGYASGFLIGKHMVSAFAVHPSGSAKD